MTISTGYSPDTYSGDNSTTVFSYTFRILDEDHIEVVLIDASGNQTVQTKTTHYTVSGVGNSGGGNVTFLSAPSGTETVMLRRNTPLEQQTDYVEADIFPAETHEEALDKLTTIVQQLDEKLSRAVTAPNNNIITDGELGDTEIQSDYIVKVNNAGTGFEAVAFEGALQVDDLTEMTQSQLDKTADFLIVWDDSTSTHKKISVNSIGINFVISGAGIAINELNDVSISSVASGQILKYNGTNWVNNTLDEAGITHNALTDYVANEHIDWTSTTENLSTSGTAATGALTVTGNIVVTGTVDGRDIATDGTKLDGIEANATADQTTEEIQDAAWSVLTGTQTGITVTYQDGTDDVDFVVSDTTVAGDTGSTGITPGDTLTIAGGTEITTSMSGDTLTINSDFTPSSTATLTNKTFDANGTGNSLSNVDVADLASGTDGELITWDASGNPTTVAVGTSGHVLTSNGAGAAPTFQAAAGGGGGKVLQVVQTVDTTNRSTTSTSFTSTGVSVSITPSSTSNKILLIAHWTDGHSDANACRYTFYRDSTDLTPSGVNGLYDRIGITSTQAQNATMTYLDSPSTTSAISYTIRWKVTADTAYMGRRSSSTTVDGPTVLTAIEIDGT